jgi:actin-related protein
MKRTHQSQQYDSVKRFRVDAEQKVEEKQEQEVEEKQEQKVEEKQEQKVEEKQDQKVEEKQEQEVEEKQDQKVEEKQEQEVEEKQDQEVEEKQDQEVEEKQDQEIEEKQEQEVKSSFDITNQICEHVYTANELETHLIGGLHFVHHHIAGTPMCISDPRFSHETKYVISAMSVVILQELEGENTTWCDVVCAILEYIIHNHALPEGLDDLFSLINNSHAVNLNPTAYSEVNSVAPITSIKQRGYALNHELNEGCVLCGDGFTDGQEILALPCDHIFHIQCPDTSKSILDWLYNSTHRNCPICRVKVS